MTVAQNFNLMSEYITEQLMSYIRIRWSSFFRSRSAHVYKHFFCSLSSGGTRFVARFRVYVYICSDEAQSQSSIEDFFLLCRASVVG